MGLHTLPWTTFILSLLSLVHCFSFSYSAPLTCQPLQISWQGGKPPFTLQVTPEYDVPRVFSLPDSTYNGTHGGYTTPPLQLNATGKFMLTMSDATGFASGGNSGVLIVGSSPVQCDRRSGIVDFTYDLDMALAQCRQYEVKEFPANRQVTITGLIPLGTWFQYKPNPGSTLFSWPMNIKSGTTIILFLTDSDDKTGGTSDFLTVASSDETSCLDATSPHSTIEASPGPSAIASTGNGSPTESPTSSALPQAASPATIAGVIAGTVVFLLALSSLIVFLIRRRRERRTNPYLSKRGSRRLPSVELFEEPSDRQGFGNQTRYPPRELEPVPYLMPERRSQDVQSSTPESSSTSPYHTRSYGDNVRDYGTPTSSTAMTKAQMAASLSSSSTAPTRFVLHTDAGALESTEDVTGGVVELPPTYHDISSTSRSIPDPSSTYVSSQSSQSAGYSPSLSGAPQLPPFSGDFGRL